MLGFLCFPFSYVVFLLFGDFGETAVAVANVAVVAFFYYDCMSMYTPLHHIAIAVSTAKRAGAQKRQVENFKKSNLIYVQRPKKGAPICNANEMLSCALPLTHSLFPFVLFVHLSGSDLSRS